MHVIGTNIFCYVKSWKQTVKFYAAIQYRKIRKEPIIINDFIYSYPTKVYFGKNSAKKTLTAELGRFGKAVMPAYGGGSIKANGVYYVSHKFPT